MTFDTATTLFQFFTKEHLDKGNQLTDEQWELYVSRFQSGFAQEATDFATATFADFVEELN